MTDFLTANVEVLSKDSNLDCFRKIYRLNRRTRIRRWLWGFAILTIGVMFLPWTQNIRAKGTVTTLRQEQRPQQLNALIAGTAVKWYVREGDFVKKGDTILQLGEVKVDFFDPRLLERTRRQIEAKQQTIDGYKNKATATIDQSNALAEGMQLKLRSLDNKILQQQLKIQTDETDVLAASNQLNAYTRQFQAGKIMYDSGAISLVDLEKRRVNYQDALAKNTSANNKLLQSKQELANLKIEQMSIVQEYKDKIAKADGDRFASLSSAASTEAELSKLENDYSNYDARNKLYYVTAPQSGQITKAKKAGIGEFLKEGEMIVEIVPDSIQYAIEMFVKPVDLPLINIGQKVRFVFDGFPAIVFSGWPGGSYGTFGGRVIAIEKSISENGTFRVLVVEDPDDRKWPAGLRIGGGAQGIALLKDVRIFYELWRNINGFPPEYYEPSKMNKN